MTNYQLKHYLLFFMMLNTSIASINAQKLFTLDDLLSGGKTYKNMTPKLQPLMWNGDELVPKRENQELKKLENADLASNGNIAYTKDHNLYVKLASDAPASSAATTIAVSTDGSLDLVYGESVHRNEFGIQKGTFWSPSGKLLAFYRMDQSMVTSYPQVDIRSEWVQGVHPSIGSGTGFKGSEGYESYEGSRVAVMMPDKYPMAGETSHKVTVGIYNTENQKITYLQAGDPTDRYFTNISWSPDESKIYMIELNRDQKHAELTCYDVADGKKVGVLFTEDNDKYVEPMHPISFLPWDSSKFVYQSRRDGYNHIYIYDITGSQLQQLTSGHFEVFDILGFYPEKKLIIYSSNEQDIIGQSLYSLTTKGKRTLLNKEDGWHKGTLSASGRYLLDVYSSPTISGNTDRIDIKTGYTERIETSTEPWEGYKVPEITTGTIKAADGVTDLYYRLVLPSDFNPEKKYPTVVYVYGGPHAHNVDASRHWGVRGWDIWMAQRGYVVFCLDNRGSEHRGMDFEQTTFRHLGVEEMKDQLQGVEFLKSLPYVDADRLGVHGWSFGGFMTISLMTTYPDVFKVGVAGGPVIDWRYYEVMYGERYMDTPQTNPEGYAETSLLGKAANLKGRLLVIYGGNDPTCVPQHTLSFMRACIDGNTYPDLFTYPGSEHNMKGTDRIHLHHKITQYFDDFL